ncbi:MAG: nucleotidyltransferase family protein [Nitrospira sp.]|nr:MAG: nucleotidyltransferase family protein [Nitrospira sp.]
MPGLKALVLAAGKSTRLASITGGRPKPLVEVQGESVLARNLRWLASQGVEETWINLHYRPEEIQAAIGNGERFGLNVRYRYEPDILGTAGAVRNLAHEWTGTFLVIYGDNLLSLDVPDFLAFHRAHKAGVTIALFDQDRHRHTGIAGGRVELAPNGQVVGFHEGQSERGTTFVNAGVYLVEPDIVPSIPPCQLYDFGRDLFPRLLEEHQYLYGYLISGYCLGLDTPESYREALRLVREGEVRLT